MNRYFYHLTVFTFIGCLSMSCFASKETTFEKGTATISGNIRAKYQENNFSSNNEKHIDFDNAKIVLDYESSKIYAHVEYRCYQYKTLCDFSTLVDGYAGYHLNKNQNITIGVQPIPFGVARFWDTTLFGGINSTLGLQDVHNLGINYHNEFESIKIDLAFFITDGGNYKGYTQDSARYSANYVKSDDTTISPLNEKNMWISRFSQNFEFDTSTKLLIGGSYWYSDIKNINNGESGSRNAWSLFSVLTYQDTVITLTGGHNEVNNKDNMRPNISSMGSYDSEYNVANKGEFYTEDIRHTFKDKIHNGLNITPYATHSLYQKSKFEYKDTSRSFIGLSLDYKNSSLILEYIMGKNDPFVGGNKESLAQGDNNKLSRLLNLTYFYHF